MFSVSILEAKTIIRTINKTYGTDLSGLAMASFRLRLSEILGAHQFRHIEILASRLLEEPEFYESFLRDISIGSPDMFRDPDLWIEIRVNVLPSIIKNNRYPEVVIPESITGDELHTMVVLLKESGLDYRVDLHATCRNELIRKQVMSGELSHVRFKNSISNYEVFNPSSSFENYTEIRNGVKYLKPDLLQGINIRVQSADQPICSDKTALVLYRNRMIYQSTELQYRQLKRLLEEMKVGTYFITGIREVIDGFGLENYYSSVSSDLKIYIKTDGN